MKLTLRSIAAFLILVLGGCGSFNNSFNHYQWPVTLEEHKTISDTASGTSSKNDDEEPSFLSDAERVIEKPVNLVKAACSVTPYPTPSHPPELPLKALQEAKGDVYVIEKIERKHIDELRAYISERRRLQHDALVAFNEKCITSNK